MVQSSMDAYRSAKRLGKKYITDKNNNRHSGLLPVLEPQLEEVCAELPLGCKDIPLDKIRGTFATGRAGAFAGNFMPLLEDSTEFSRKWQSLYTSATKIGITEPIKVYEYLGYYYVLEGHKRVSVARFLSAYSLSADIIRLRPPLHEGDPVHAVYLEYIRPDPRILVDHMWFSVPGRLSSLRKLAAQAYPDHPNVYTSAEGLLHGLFYDFRAAYHKLGLAKTLPDITTGDAFWQYVGLYGLPIDLTDEQLQKSIKTCEPQFVSMVDSAQSQTLSDPSELDSRQSFLSFFKSGHITLLFAYCGVPGRRYSATVHDVGRFALTRTFPQLNVVTVDNLPSDGTGYPLLRDAMKAYQPNLVFATDATMEMAALRVSLEFKNSLTLISHDQTPGSLDTYYANTAQPAFLLGICAGSLSQTGRIGYLRPSMALGGREHDLQAFAQGIKMVRPGAEIFFSIPRRRNKEDGILPRWAGLNIDMAWIPQFYGYPAPSHKVFPGVYASLAGLTRTGTIADIYAYGAWHWDSFYTRLAAEILEGSPDMLTSQAGRLHFRLNLSSGIMGVHPAGPVLSHWPRQLLAEMRKALIQGLNPLNESNPVEVIEV